MLYNHRTHLERRHQERQLLQLLHIKARHQACQQRRSRLQHGARRQRLRPRASDSRVTSSAIAAGCRTRCCPAVHVLQHMLQREHWLRRRRCQCAACIANALLQQQRHGVGVLS